jgi:hypothetical protein
MFRFAQNDKVDQTTLADLPFMDELLSMRRNFVLLLLYCLLAVLPACKKRETPPPPPRDVCALITLEEIQTVQGSPIKESKSSARADAGLRVSQCFYTATEFSKSVNLALVQRDPDHPSGRNAKDFWKEKFDPYENEEPQKDGDDEKEQGSAPKKIEGLGDDAYWVSNRFGGTLYVLKGDAFMSIGLGGTDDEETKLTKSRALAQKALQRL